ncbi:MAG TPA: DUF4251 domain-containing protein [Mucilaginibacter sp.]|jgi:hypothetical protein|nr:DUF4251 domain-containing protein [Mucilaginibacter sp.]
MKTLLKFVVVLTLALACSYAAGAQTPKQSAKAQAVKNMVNNINFVFQANYVNPQRGGARSIDYGYDLVVSKDTITAYLPYYGRAYVAPTDPTEGGIKFKTTHFDYKAKTNKKGGWDILIVPKDKNISDMRDVQSLRLSITSTGYASLNVTSTNRDFISFDGYIEARRK